MERNASFILMHNHESVSKNVKDIPLSLKEKESGYKGLHLELLRVLLFQHIFQEQIFLGLDMNSGKNQGSQKIFSTSGDGALCLVSPVRWKFSTSQKHGHEFLQTFHCPAFFF